MATLLLEHSSKTSNPLRLASSSEDPSELDSDEERTYTQKYRKVTIRIWQDFGDYHSIWENLTQSSSTPGQFALVLGIYQAVLDHYIAKKAEIVQNEIKRKPKDNKMRRSSEIKKIKIEKPKNPERIEHGDSCFFCDDGGKLICCEGCPKVVHPLCIGLKKVPDEDWFCDECRSKEDLAPQTRLRSRLKKLAL